MTLFHCVNPARKPVSETDLTKKSKTKHLLFSNWVKNSISKKLNFEIKLLISKIEEKDILSYKVPPLNLLPHDCDTLSEPALLLFSYATDYLEKFRTGNHQNTNYIYSSSGYLSVRQFLFHK